MTDRERELDRLLNQYHRSLEWALALIDYELLGSDLPLELTHRDLERYARAWRLLGRNVYEGGERA